MHLLRKLHKRLDNPVRIWYNIIMEMRKDDFSLIVNPPNGDLL